MMLAEVFIEIIIFVSHAGCSYLSLCFCISKPIRMCLVYPVQTDQKTFKEGEKASRSAPHSPSSSDHLPAHPAHL